MHFVFTWFAEDPYTHVFGSYIHISGSFPGALWKFLAYGTVLFQLQPFQTQLGSRTKKSDVEDLIALSFDCSASSMKKHLIMIPTACKAHYLFAI